VSAAAKFIMAGGSAAGGVKINHVKSIEWEESVPGV